MRTAAAGKRSGEQGHEDVPKGVAAVERALRLLEAFDAPTRSIGLTELAERVGLPKSTVLRLIGSLVAHGFVQVTSDGRHQLGSAVLRLAAVYQKTARPEDLIRPVLERLAAASGESASMNIREGELQVCLYRVDSAHALRDHIRAGQCFPLDRGCSAQVLRAASGEAGARFDRVRSEIVVVTHGEVFSGTSGIAVPVFGLNQVLVGALILSGPTSRFTQQAVAQMKRLLVEAGGSLTQQLGGNPAAFRMHYPGKSARRSGKGRS
ncbi:MAG: IclR family transcriptional regulator [Lautropia sp.]|nr:MAG: IclR family transcriptional regulator [Pseudomonadota bacterium]MBC6959682.1 IclR family transcriptional regulator [Lautropia sp.]MCL4701570.1 IclR family transcriptional regulator [Burkholderiaceae bacterium]MDL1906210.1 IclR family transcriptional regulator [Betaproteobacteria bacterium PRO1]RIK91527.1 MAG: IclR family transcriptional regulator [Burkholderiales bacterium]